VRLALTAIVLALLGAATFQPFYWTILVRGRAEHARVLATLPYIRTPGLRELLEGTRLRTAAGARIGVVADPRAFMRATYVLAGRTTLPLTDGRLLGQCDYIVSYRRDVQAPGFVEVWRSNDGVLLRRVR
jgi:hypothetical protein